MSEITFRTATRDDLHAIVAMLSDDELAENREKPVGGEGVGEEYTKAFAAMEGEHYNHMLLAESDGRIVGCAAARLRARPVAPRRQARDRRIRARRVRPARPECRHGADEGSHRGCAREGGCSLVQLTSDTRRSRAHLFYRRLGFVQSHCGFKKDL